MKTSQFQETFGLDGLCILIKQITDLQKLKKSPQLAMKENVIYKQTLLLENDLWIITKLNIKENDDGIIRRNDEIVLQHKQTKKFLSWSNFLTYSQSGYQVQGLNSKPITGFQLEYFENQPLRVNSPFLIKIINKNLYLSQQNIQTESKAGSQKEAAFVQKFSGSCLWVVESRNK